MGCGCKGAQAKARAAVNSGNVSSVVQTMREVLRLPAQAVVVQSTAQASNGVFVQTGKKIDNEESK